MDVVGYPFRVVPYLPVYMAIGVLVAGLLGLATVGLVRVLQGRDRARAAIPYVRRVTVLWMILAVVGIYLFPFLLGLLVGAPFG